MVREPKEAVVHWIQPVEASHRQVLEVVERLSGENDLPVMLETIFKLRGLLADHFQEEEGDDGLFDQILDGHPGAAAAVGRLIDQHRRILEAIDGLQQMVAACVEEHRQEITSLRDRLVRDIRRHEGEEGRLTTDVLNLELGGPG